MAPALVSELDGRKGYEPQQDESLPLIIAV